jgi:glycerate kinase
MILIPDSLKGTMSSLEIMKAEIAKHYPRSQIISIPVADGGEGSIDCFLRALGGERITIPVNNPLFEIIDGTYGLIDGGKTAVVEMAACAGLPLIESRKDPLGSTTYGVGEMILDAARRGVRKIIVGLGGSATNDGGCGAASAAGIKFYNGQGEIFVPTGGNLREIARIDPSRRDPALDQVEIISLCDIDNPMFGPAGAAQVFGPQKGAAPDMIRVIDEGLEHLADIILRDMGKSVAGIPGAGAAGGMGAGLSAFFGARMRMGIEAVLDTVRFDELLSGADMVITGEGRIDRQSLRGKAVIGVARRAKRANVPVVAVVGDIGEDIAGAYEEGVTSIVSINRAAVDFSEARKRAKSDLALTVDNLMRFCKRMEQVKGGAAL